MFSTLSGSEGKLEKLGFKKNKANEWVYAYAGRGGFRLKKERFALSYVAHGKILQRGHS